MSTSFHNITARNIGTSSYTIITASEKQLIIGNNFANNTPFDLTISVWVSRSSVITKLATNVRILGSSNKELFGKILLEVGDILLASCPVDNGIDASITILSGLA